MISEMNTTIVRVNGVPMRMPHDEMRDPHQGAPIASTCGALEPDWPDGQGGNVRCTRPPHSAGPSGTVHIARGGEDEVLAIWGATALIDDRDY
jgi:hypothetical protein